MYLYYKKHNLSFFPHTHTSSQKSLTRLNEIDFAATTHPLRDPFGGGR